MESAEVSRKRRKKILVLSRKPGEQIFIGDDIVITIVRMGPNTVRVGIEAPRDMKVLREELILNDGNLPAKSIYDEGTPL